MLIATVYPLGLLVIGFEIRQVPRVVATHPSGTILLWALGIVLVTGLVTGIISVDRCVRSVATGVPLNEPEVVLIAVAGNSLYSGVFLLLMASLLDRLGVLKALGRRAIQRTAASERRTARTLHYIKTHHPDADRPD